MPSPAPIVRELPTKVAETFYVVQDPALFNTSYSDALLVRPLLSGLKPSQQCAGRDDACAPGPPHTRQGQKAPTLLHQSAHAACKHAPARCVDRCWDPVDPFTCCCRACPQTFVDAAILAYECGMNEDSLRHELKVYKTSLEQQVAPPGMVRAPHQQQQHAKSAQHAAECCAWTLLWARSSALMQCVLLCSCCPLCHTLVPCTQALNEDGCMLGAKIVWMTLMETRSVRRWAACELGSSRAQCTRSAGRSS